MAPRVASLLCVIAACVGALRVPLLTRRSVLGSLAGVPAAATAAEFSGYKSRDYGNGENTAPGNVVNSKDAAKKTVCADDERLAPDGFGGKV